MTVYVAHPLNDKSLDISDAAAFGELRFVNSKYVYADELDGEDLPQNVINKILKVTDEFDTENDYLLIAGDHLQLLALASSLTARWGRFKTLRYDRVAKGYIPVAINFDMLPA